MIRNLTLICLLGITLFISSCGEDEPIITPDPPTVTLTDSNGLTSSEVQPGTTVEFIGLAEGNAAISTANIYVDELQERTYTPSGISTFQFPSFSYTPTEQEKGLTITITYEAIDINGKSSEASYTLSVAAETLMAYDSMGAILGNRIGPDQSAWNLVDNVREGQNATTSDMQNPSIATGTTDDQWIKGWDGENGTMFAKANGFDYENATVEAAIAAYADATPTANIRDVAVGDIYIAKLRGQEAYAVISIMEVDNAVTSGSRTEKITFSYKKESATTGQ